MARRAAANRTHEGGAAARTLHLLPDGLEDQLLPLHGALALEGFGDAVDGDVRPVRIIVRALPTPDTKGRVGLLRRRGGNRFGFVLVCGGTAGRQLTKDRTSTLRSCGLRAAWILAVQVPTTVRSAPVIMRMCESSDGRTGWFCSSGWRRPAAVTTERTAGTRPKAPAVRSAAVSMVRRSARLRGGRVKVRNRGHRPPSDKHIFETRGSTPAEQAAHARPPFRDTAFRAELCSARVSPSLASRVPGSDGWLP